MGRRTGRLHQPGGTSEERLGPGADHQCGHLALLGDRPRIGHVAGVLGHRQGLAGKGGLVHGQVIAVQQLGVRGHDVPQAQADDVARDQGGGIDALPVAIAQGARLQRQLPLERLQGVGRLELLPEADHRVEHQHDRDDDQIVPAFDHGGQNGRHLDHPGNRAPEVAREPRPGTCRFLLQGIGTVLGQPAAHLLLAQARRAGLQLSEERVDAGGLRIGAGASRALIQVVSPSRIPPGAPAADARRASARSPPAEHHPVVGMRRPPAGGTAGRRRIELGIQVPVRNRTRPNRQPRLQSSLGRERATMMEVNWAAGRVPPRIGRERHPAGRTGSRGRL